MKVTAAFLCIALPWTGAACTIGPVTGDAGSTSSATPMMTLGDQCQSVITPYCQQLPACGINIGLATCIANYVPLCCIGSACSAPSTVSASKVTACARMNAMLDCNTVVNTANPASCLTN